jgi:hypothetical protein
LGTCTRSVSCCSTFIIPTEVSLPIREAFSSFLSFFSILNQNALNLKNRFLLLFLYRGFWEYTLFTIGYNGYTYISWRISGKSTSFHLQKHLRVNPLRNRRQEAMEYRWCYSQLFVFFSLLFKFRSDFHQLWFDQFFFLFSLFFLFFFTLSDSKHET